MKTLTFEQMEQVNGGSWFSDAWDWICNAAEWVWDHLFVTTWEDALKTYIVTGIGGIINLGF